MFPLRTSVQSTVVLGQRLIACRTNERVHRHPVRPLWTGAEKYVHQPSGDSGTQPTFSLSVNIRPLLHDQGGLPTFQHSGPNLSIM
jgi:hypothetical protein